MDGCELPDDGRFVCRADRVFDGRQVIPDAAVIVDGDRIEGVVRAADVPAGLPELFLPDCTIVPGLIDAHVHFMRYQGPLYLAHGVTTVRDTGNRLDWILARRSEWRDRPWPRIVCVGPLIDGPQPCWPDVGRGCADADEGVAAVRETAEAGVDGIKLYAGLPAQWLAPMAAAAHDAGLRVCMHCQAASALEAGAAGVDEFFHLDGLTDEFWPGHPAGWLDVWGAAGCEGTVDAQEAVADRIAELGMIVTPTLAYWHSRSRSALPDYPPEAELALLPPEVGEWQRACCARELDPAASATWGRALEAAQRFVGLLLARDVCVLPGTDVPCEQITAGRSLWRELSLLVGSGMSPVRALRAATCEAAELLEIPGVGTLAPGSAADLVFVSGDPTARIPEEPETPVTVRSGRALRFADWAAQAAGEARDLASDPWHTAFRRSAGLIS